MRLERFHAVVANGGNQLVDEMLGAYISDLGPRFVRNQSVADALHEVGLAQTDAAVNQQWIVGNVVRFRWLLGGGSCDLVGLALDESLESMAWIQVVGHRWRTMGPQARSRGAGFAAAHKDANPLRHVVELTQCVGDGRPELSLHVIAHDLVGCHKVESGIIENGFQWPQPEIDIILRQTVCDQQQTALPQGFGQDQGLHCIPGPRRNAWTTHPSAAGGTYPQVVTGLAPGAITQIKSAVISALGACRCPEKHSHEKDLPTQQFAP